MRTPSRLLAISSLGLALAGTADARTRPHYGGELRVESATPNSSIGTIAADFVTESLTSIDSDGQVQPLLAERWDSQNGGRRWQFWLRTNVRFHDGKVLSGADVTEALNNKRGAPWRTVRANGSTVIVECDDPQLLLPETLALRQFAIFSTDTSGVLIGTGPFRLTGAPGTSIKLVAFDDYWQGRTYLDSVVVTGGRGLRDQWLDLSVARAEIVEVPAEQIRRAQQERIRTLLSRNMELIALVLSTNSQALQDARMRQAISAAVDRTSLLNVIFQKQGEVATGILPNWMTGYDFLFSSGQNLALARDLRNQVKQNGTITISYESGDSIQQLLAERVVLNARDAGIAMQSGPRGVREVDLELVRTSLASTNSGLALHQITASFLPDETEAVAADLNSIYADERELLSSARIIPLLYVPRAFGGSPRLRNWTLGPDGLPAIAQIWMEDRR